MQMHTAKETFAMQYDALIFDMDGTLLNTLEEIADAMNAALATLGFPPHDYDAYRMYVGYGMDMLAGSVLPEDSRDDAHVNRCVDAMRRIYGERYAYKSKPYDGIPELLDALSEKGISMTILSNKPDDFTRKMTEKLLGRWRFALIRGVIPGQPRKPDPAAALDIAETLGVLPERVAFLGDSAIDMTTANRAGMFSIGVLWGFRTKEELVESGAKLLIAHPLELLDFLDP
jgi:phosphoglycolate phosphatase